MVRGVPSIWVPVGGNVNITTTTTIMFGLNSLNDPNKMGPRKLTKHRMQVSYWRHQTAQHKRRGTPLVDELLEQRSGRHASPRDGAEAGRGIHAQ